jgi:TolB-like protein/Tfp pilus assembly protein PilF
MSIFSELRRRNVFRVAATYVVSAWLLIEIGNTLEETLNLPEWADTFVAFLLIIGFPIVVFFSWAYEITPEGIKREKDIDPADTSRSVTASKLNRALFVVMAIALAYFVVDEFYFERVQAPAAGAPGAAVVEQASTPSAVTASEGSPQEVPGETAPAIPDKSIAVLPFVNLSSDPEQEFFSDGLTEELLNLLAGIDDLKVAARTSSFYYKNKLEDITMKEVAQQLEVAHILEGSVRKGGDKIRITAQLIKADDGFHLWSETYDRTMDDVFAIQDEIAAAVVEQLKLTLLGGAVHQNVVDSRSYELSLRARFLFNRREPGDIERAFELFEQALETDPDNVMALVGVTPLYIWLFNPPRINEALAAVNRALELEPDNPEALARKAFAMYWSGAPAEEVIPVWEHTLKVGQNNVLVIGMQAGRLRSNGQVEQSLEWQRRALELDPLHRVNIGNMADYLLALGRWEEALPHVQKLIELDPDSQAGQEFMAGIYLQKGEPEKSLETLQSLEPEDQPTALFLTHEPLLIRTLHDLGRKEAAEEELANYIKLETERSPDWAPASIASILAYMGEDDRAFEWIERGLANNPDMRIQDFLDVSFLNLVDDPRWQQVRDHFPEFDDWDLIKHESYER